MIKKISIIITACILAACIGVMIGHDLIASRQSTDTEAVFAESTEVTAQKQETKSERKSSILVEDVYADEIDVPDKDTEMTSADYSNFDTLIDDLIDATD